MQKLRTEGKNGRMETGLDDVVIYNWGHKIKSLNFLFAWFFLHSCMSLLLNYDEIHKQTHKTRRP